MSDTGRKPKANAPKRLVADRRYPAKSSGGGGKGRKPPAARPARKRRAAKPRRGGILGLITGFFRLIWRVIWGFTWRVSLVALLLLAAATGYVYTTLPTLDKLVDGRARGSVTLLDRHGDVFAWRGQQFGGVVTANSVSPHLKNAVIATEDKRFYRHLGISPRGVASAVRINLREGRGPLSGHGGSTITQQTAKLLCLGVEYDPSQWESQAAYEKDCRRGSLSRKAKEAIYALAMELKYTKDDILTVYLNRAYMGGGAHGAEAAAQRFFGKSSADVSAAEGAMLAGLLTAPTTFAPTSNLQRSQDRALTVLKLMQEQGYLSARQAAEARSNPAVLSKAAEARAGGYFADWVMSTGPDFFTRNTTEDVIIRTTLDQKMQQQTEEALQQVFETKVREGSKAQAAIVVMSADGAVRAMVGGRNTNGSGLFNRATQARRQTGSAFKPFVYATALDLGWSPNALLVDEPITLNIPGSGPWSPKNYTNKHYGQVTMTYALKESLNIPAVKVSENVGRDNVRKVANDFGLESDLAAGPALALGASESTLIEMTGAYAGILNGGSSVQPYGLVELRLQGEADPLMNAAGGIGERVIQDEAARQLIWMMEKVVSDGSGGRARLDRHPAAGKTGTTQAARDAWFVGFTADYVAGVWMGYDDNTPLTGVTGGGLPAEIWKEVMARIHADLPVRQLPMIPPLDGVLEIEGTDAQAPREDVADTVVRKVLRDLFGSGSGQQNTNPGPKPIFSMDDH